MSRFGVTIHSGSPDKKEFQQIVRTLAERNGIDMPEDQLLLEGQQMGAEPRPESVRAYRTAVCRLCVRKSLAQQQNAKADWSKNRLRVRLYWDFGDGRSAHQPQTGAA